MMGGLAFFFAWVVFIFLALDGIPESNLEWGIMLAPGLAVFIFWNTANRVTWEYLKEHETKKYENLKNQEAASVNMLWLCVILGLAYALYIAIVK